MNIRDTTSPPKLLQKQTSKSTKVDITNSKLLIKCLKESSESYFPVNNSNYAHIPGAIIGDGDRKRAPFQVLGLSP